MDAIPSADPRTYSLRARYVFPVSGPPLRDGYVTVRGERIIRVDRDRPRGAVEDLGNVAMLPGLVNAHTHLEFSELSRPLGEPGMPLVDWIRTVLDWSSRSDGMSQWPIARGLRESIGCGVTTLGEITRPARTFASGEPNARDVTAFLELIAPSSEGVMTVLNFARGHLRACRKSGTWLAGLSPHAPYTVHPHLLKAAVRLSANEGVPLAMHLAESREELDLLAKKLGPFRELLSDRGVWDPGLVRAGTRPLDYLRQLSAGSRTLVIHGNYLDDDEIGFLGANRRRMAVVYCPRSHAYFRHPRYPLEKMLDAGVTVALGTDSRASAPDLNLLAEMRTVAAVYEYLPPRTVLEMGTLAGAKALGRAHKVGTLEPTRLANLAAVALPDRDAEDPHSLLFDSNRPVVAVWYRGRRQEVPA